MHNVTLLLLALHVVNQLSDYSGVYQLLLWFLSKNAYLQNMINITGSNGLSGKFSFNP